MVSDLVCYLPRPSCSIGYSLIYVHCVNVYLTYMERVFLFGFFINVFIPFFLLFDPDFMILCGIIVKNFVSSKKSMILSVFALMCILF